MQLNEQEIRDLSRARKIVRLMEMDEFKEFIKVVDERLEVARKDLETEATPEDFRLRQGEVKGLKTVKVILTAQISNKNLLEEKEAKPDEPDSDAMPGRRRPIIELEK